MKKIAIACIMAAASLGFAGNAAAQGMRDIRINEIMVRNSDGLKDTHGHTSGWIELYNTGYTVVNIAGAYLTTTETAVNKMYKIPSTKNMMIPPKGYIVFFASGNSHEGEYSTNFVLDTLGTENHIRLFDASGKELIDEVVYDGTAQQDDISLGWDDTKEVPTWDALEYSSPNGDNNVHYVEPKHETVKRQDPRGVGMAITAMSVVLFALLCLYLVFRTIGKTMIRMAGRKDELAQAQNDKMSVAKAVKEVSGPHGEISAAIAYAVHLYQEDLHDVESTVLTINKVARAYSPWSSKLYGMRQMPDRNKK